MAKNLEDRVKELEKEVVRLKGKAALKIQKALGIGDTFQLMDVEWKILDITKQGYVCLAETIGNKTFGSNNDWKESSIRKYLNGEFYEKLAEKIGADNIISFKRDLLSMDGQTEYGTCEDKVSILSFDEYRKYRSLIPNAGYYWWLITPDSTPCNDDSEWIRVVSPSGRLRNIIYDYYGVRPFCIFSSSIFESEE